MNTYQLFSYIWIQNQKPIHPETDNCASCHGVNLQGQEGWQNTLRLVLLTIT